MLKYVMHSVSAAMSSSHLNNNKDECTDRDCLGCIALQARLDRAMNCLSCIELQIKLEHTEEALKNARKAAREGLMDMVEQNAKLVAAYVEKKREVKQLQAVAKEDRRLWQQRLQRLEHELQANKLHIQALMQQLHSIASKQALGADAATPPSSQTPQTYCKGSSQHCTAGVAAAASEAAAESCSPSSSAGSSAGSSSAFIGEQTSCFFTAAESPAASCTTAKTRSRVQSTPGCTPLGDATNTLNSSYATPTSKLQPLKQQYSSLKSSKTAARRHAVDQENCCPETGAPAAGTPAALSKSKQGTASCRPAQEENMAPQGAAGAAAAHQHADTGSFSSAMNPLFKQEQQTQSAGQQHDKQQLDGQVQLGDLQSDKAGTCHITRHQQQQAFLQDAMQQQHAQCQPVMQQEQDQRQRQCLHEQQQQEQLTQLAQRNQQLEAENAMLKQAQAEAAALRERMQRMQQAEQLKQRGNTFYQSQQYKEACQAYTDALNLKVEDATFNAVLLCNRAAALQCCGRYVDALSDCCMAASMDEQYPRVLQRRAEAYIALEDFGSAVADLQRLAQLTSSSKEAAARLKDAQHKLRAQAGAGPDYYAVLGVQHGCTAAEVKAAYKKLALKHHPDKATGPHAKAAAETVFVLITAANAVLSDPAKRAAHDSAHLAIRARRCMSTSGGAGVSRSGSTPQQQRTRQYAAQPAHSSSSTSSSASSSGMYSSWHYPHAGGFGYAAASEAAAAKAAAAAAAEAARWRSASGQQQARHASNANAAQSRHSSGSNSSSSTGGASHYSNARYC